MTNDQQGPFHQQGPIAGMPGAARAAHDWSPEAGSSSPLGLLFGIGLLMLAVGALVASTQLTMPFGLDVPSDVVPALIGAAGHSLLVALGGVAIGIGIAIPLCAIAAALAATAAARAVLFAALWLRDLQALVVLSLAPVVLALLGIGNPGVLAIAGLGAALALGSSLIAGLAGRTVARDAAARGAPSGATPQVGPALVRSLRQAFAMAFTATVVTEGIFGQAGLGFAVMQAVSTFLMGPAIAAVALTWIAAATPLGVLLVVEWAVSRAHGPAQARGW